MPLVERKAKLKWHRGEFGYQGRHMLSGSCRSILWADKSSACSSTSFTLSSAAESEVTSESLMSTTVSPGTVESGSESLKLNSFKPCVAVGSWVRSCLWAVLLEEVWTHVLPFSNKSLGIKTTWTPVGSCRRPGVYCWFAHWRGIPGLCDSFCSLYESQYAFLMGMFSSSEDELLSESCRCLPSLSGCMLVVTLTLSLMRFSQRCKCNAIFFLTSGSRLPFLFR